MSDPRTEKGEQLYLKHLESWKHLESERQEAIEMAERNGEDVEQLKRAYALRLQDEERLQEAERQSLGKDPRRRSENKEELSEAERRTEATQKWKEIKEKQKARDLDRDGR